MTIDERRKYHHKMQSIYRNATPPNVVHLGVRAAVPAWGCFPARVPPQVSTLQVKRAQITCRGRDPLPLLAPV